MDYITRQEDALEFRYDGELLRIEAWGENAFRVRSVMMGELIDSDYALLPPETSDVTIRTDGTSGAITNGKITAKLTVSSWRKSCRISFYNQDGRLLLREQDDGGALNRKIRQFTPRLGGDYSLSVYFDAEDEKLYGMGQYQQEILDIKGCTLELAHRNSQASVPFVLSSRGYGFLWHNPAIGRVTFAKNMTSWHAESTKQMDYWIVAGDSPDEITQAYGQATGTVPMMPEYGMGFWQCKLRYWNQEQLLAVAREYYRRKIPVDVIVCDFFHWPKMGDFRFEEEFFPDPRAMAAELQSYGMELMVSVWPQVSLRSENYEEMKQQGLLVKAERGVEVAMRFADDESTFFDATNPGAREYVWNKCKKNYYDSGIRVFWLDEAEPEYSAYDFDNYRYHMGPNLQIGNIFPQLYSRAFFDGQTAAGQEQVINLVRCAWAGSQRYGALVWSGDIHSDWTDLRRQLCAGLNMGLAGIPWWTTDIGGFGGGDPADPEFRQLLIRWFEWGCFCPVMRLHGDRAAADRHVYHKDGTEALFTGGDNEIWSFGEENTPIFEKYIRLREKMRPYIRTLMQEAHTKGRPVMRTMFYEFPEDETCWETEDQYMFGGKLLVAPILYKDAVSRKVYLPKGRTWWSVLDKEKYEGGRWITVTAELDQIPVFADEEKMARELAE